MDWWRNHAPVGAWPFDIKLLNLSNCDRFWERTIPHAGANTQKRFIATFIDYQDAVIQQIIDQREGHIRDINNYLDLRRDTSAVKPTFALIEIGLDIPDEVMSHPAIEVMISTSVDMVILNNVSSFLVEPNNI